MNKISYLILLGMIVMGLAFTGCVSQESLEKEIISSLENRDFDLLEKDYNIYLEKYSDKLPELKESMRPKIILAIEKYAEDKDTDKLKIYIEKLEKLDKDYIKTLIQPIIQKYLSKENYQNSKSIISTISECEYDMVREEIMSIFNDYKDKKEYKEAKLFINELLGMQPNVIDKKIVETINAKPNVPIFEFKSGQYYKERFVKIGSSNKVYYTSANSELSNGWKIYEGYIRLYPGENEIEAKAINEWGNVSDIVKTSIKIYSSQEYSPKYAKKFNYVHMAFYKKLKNTFDKNKFTLKSKTGDVIKIDKISKGVDGNKNTILIIPQTKLNKGAYIMKIDKDTIKFTDGDVYNKEIIFQLIVK
ncbi:hypothetical protein [Abyssisolibacter fermentans]|uniref:hypothetical protein n=1 Tax=Abyssisolibacter fermentans TaxID=1766203 RepID=UPI0008378491|nr:hypothetical protein [Abyssisolibacter fermentans]